MIKKGLQRLTFLPNTLNLRRMRLIGERSTSWLSAHILVMVGALGLGHCPLVLASPSADTRGEPPLRPAPQDILDGAEWSSGTASGTDDPVLRLLSDKGLISLTPSTPSLADEVKGKASDLAADLVISAMEFLGVPYRHGGNSADEGFDCSGFTRHVFENSLGLILPRRASDQARAPGLLPVARHDLKPGDLVFFNTLRRTFSHVGIYIGDDKFIHSPRAGGQVRIEDMRLNYWQKRFDGARRAPIGAEETIIDAAHTRR